MGCDLSLCVSSCSPMGHGENRTVCVSTNVLISLLALCLVPVNGSYACGFSCPSQDLMELRSRWPNIFGLGFYLGFFCPSQKLHAFSLAAEEMLWGAKLGGCTESPGFWQDVAFLTHVVIRFGLKIWNLLLVSRLGMLVSWPCAGTLVIARQFSMLQLQCHPCNTGISPVGQTFSNMS